MWIVFTLLLLVGACWVVAVARPWVRVVTLALSVVAFSFAAFSTGRTVEGLNLIRQAQLFSAYSSALHRLAKDGQDAKLREIVTRFDDTYQKSPFDFVTVEQTLIELLPANPAPPAGKAPAASASGSPARDLGGTGSPAAPPVPGEQIVPREFPPKTATHSPQAAVTNAPATP